jgi:hypothetical protein
VSFLTLGGCKTITKSRIDAAIWLNNAPLPKEICEANPDLYKRGFYRRLDSGKLEFISFCNPLARRWVSAFDEDFQKILEEAGIDDPRK